MPLTRLIVELYEQGIYTYFMNGIFSFKKFQSEFKIVTFNISELRDYMRYLTVKEFITMVENRLQ